MNTSNIDKEIINLFLPNEEMSYYKGDERNLFRCYQNKNKDVTLMIFEGLNAEIINELLLNKNFEIAIIRYKGKFIALLAHGKQIKFVYEDKMKPKVDDFSNTLGDNIDVDVDDLPYAYTNGRWTPCPYCGSDRISTFMDGTAQCDECKREFRYLQY